MFNRKLQVDVVKRQKTSQTTSNEVQSVGFEKKAKIVSDILGKIATKVVIGVCAYVVLDTFRKTVVESAKN